jgi:hypothetical protein
MVALVATETKRLGDVLKYEFEREMGFCRKAVTAYESGAKTYTPGTVLGKTLVSGSAAAVAGGANTGNGTMGSITVSSHAKVGQYVLRITVASSNAGAFELLNSNGSVVGTGNVASAFVGAGLAFTLADGSTDFIVGDTFVITVTGTEKYKILENTASDGSAAFAGIYIGASNGLGIDTSVAATTDTTVLILERGPALVAKEGLTLGASINTAAEKAALYAQMAAVGIIAEAQI